MNDAVKKDGDDVTIDPKALGLPDAPAQPETGGFPGIEPGAVSRTEDGKIKIDLAKVNISDEHLKAMDTLMTNMVAERPALAAGILNRIADDVDAFSAEEAGLSARIRAAAVRATEPILPDAEGFMVGTTHEKIKEIAAEMAEIYHEIAGIVGSEAILEDLAKGIQAVAHPGQPFVPAEQNTPSL